MDRKKDIRVIINPNAKKFRTGRVSLKSYLKFKSDMISIITPSSIEELHTETDKIAGEEPDYICIAGGDGTLHVVLSSIINSYNSKPVPPILILKEGTMDNVARTIKLKGRGPQLLKRLLEKVIEGESIETHPRLTMKINEKYCFLFGTGIVTNFLKEAYSGKEKGFVRNLQVARMSAKEALNNSGNGLIFREMHGEISIDGEKINIDPVHGLLAGTVEHIGMGFSPLPDAAKKDGAFQVIIIGMKPILTLVNLHKLRKGNNIESNKYIKCHATSIKLNYPYKYDYTMDGDLYSAEGELFIERGPVINLVKV